MSFRIVNGSTHTEDGWRCCNRDECDIVRIPELYLVDTAPLRKGPPLTILGAWLYWYDRNVEEISSAVWGWSETNDVLGRYGENDGSNHLSATAVDVNAPKYPWGKRVMPADRIAKIREGLLLFKGMVKWGEDWDRADQMHYQMRWGEGDARNDAFANDLRAGYLNIYVPAAPPSPQESYGLPAGANSNGYGGDGVRFPDWVYALGNAFGGLKPSTYPGHQVPDRRDIGAAPNPGLNRGIDWIGPPQKMLDFAHWLRDTGPARTSGVYGPPGLEMVIYQDPRTGERVGYPSFVNYGDDYGNHTNHVHTRHSASLLPPGAPPPAPPPPAPGLTVQGLADVMGNRAGVDYASMLPHYRTACALIGAAGNLNRLAMFAAQIGHESGGLQYMEEIWGPTPQQATYQGRMGNTQPGDGYRFRGSGPLQVTGRDNFTALSQWAHSKGLVPSPTFFVDKPDELRGVVYGFIGAVWYWTLHNVNRWADAGDIQNASKAINAPAWIGTSKQAHGIEDRTNRWNHAKGMGLAALDITPSAPPQGEDDFLSALSPDEQRALYNEIMGRRSSVAAFRPLGQGDLGDVGDFDMWTNGSVFDLITIELAKLKYPPPTILALLHQIAEADPFKYPDRQEDKKLARAVLADLANSEKPHTDTPVAEPPTLLPPLPIPISLPPPPVLTVVEPEPEVLPAVQVDQPVVQGNTPQDLIDTVKKLKVFDTDYRREFDNLTKGS